MIEDKIARVKALIRKREEIDAELSAIFGGAAPAKRGRPRKEQGNSSDLADHAEGKLPRETVGGQPADDKTL